MSNRVQYRRDTKARWAEVNPVLMEGEVGLEIDTKNIKMGDGVHAWNELEYGVGIENITSEPGDSENLAASQKLVTHKIAVQKGLYIRKNGNLNYYKPCKISELLVKPTKDCTFFGLTNGDNEFFSILLLNKDGKILNGINPDTNSYTWKVSEHLDDNIYYIILQNNNNSYLYTDSTEILNTNKNFTDFLDIKKNSEEILTSKGKINELEKIEKNINGNLEEIKAEIQKENCYITNTGNENNYDSNWVYSKPIKFQKGDFIIAVLNCGSDLVSVVSKCEEDIKFPVTPILLGNKNDRYAILISEDSFLTFCYDKRYGISIYKIINYSWTPYVDINNFADAVFFSKNMFNPNDVLKGYIDYASGKLINNNDALSTNNIEVDELSIYTITRCKKYSSSIAAGLHCILKNGNIAKLINPNTGNEYSYWDGNIVNGNFKTPKDAKYIKFTIYWNGADLSSEDKNIIISETQLERGEFKTEISPYEVRKQLKEEEIPQKIYDLIEKSSSVDWNNIKINFEGDSLTEAFSDRNNGWAIRASKKLGAIGINNGHSGASTQVISGKSSILTAVVSRTENYDITIIQPSTVNDNPFIIGELSDDYKNEGEVNDYDKGTYIGALEYMARYSILHLKKVGFIIPYKVAGRDAYKATYNDERVKAIISVCEKWGIPYLDLNKVAGFNLCCEDIRKIYGNYTGNVSEYNEKAGYEQDEQVRYNGFTYKANSSIEKPAGTFNELKWTKITDASSDYDNCHCNSEGYELISNKVVEFIKSL